MELTVIFRALLRSKTGAALMGLQIALTLAIVGNCLSIVQQHLWEMQRRTGTDEENIFTIGTSWVDPANPEPKVEADLAALRSLSGVVDAEPTNSFPMAGGGRAASLSPKPNQTHPTAITAQYYVDEHGLTTYGVTSISGRWFTANDVIRVRDDENKYPASVVVTQSLARALFPSGSALGQVAYFWPTGSIRIIGIVQRAETPFQGMDWGSWGNSFLENSTFEPIHQLTNGVNYVVRTKPGQQAAMMRAVPVALNHVTPERQLSTPISLADSRRHVYRSQRATAVTLAVLSALLLAITAFGVIGLTTYWVGQRRRYIGMRRALGARRIDILRYFHTENLLMAGGGCALGIALGLIGNIWLASSLELTRMSAAYICTGALAVIGLCQVATLWPALRAAAIPPAVAIRSL